MLNERVMVCAMTLYGFQNRVCVGGAGEGCVVNGG
jgi:hypothetical protein